MAIILTKSLSSTSVSGSGSGASGVYTQYEKLVFEMEMGFKTSSLYNYKELSYTDDVLTRLEIYTNSTKTNMLFNKELSYTDDVLTRTTLTRISPSASLTKILSYTDDVLTSIETSGAIY